MFTFQPLMTLTIDLGELTSLGPSAEGERRLARVAGGRFDGPELRGQVLAGGNDWQWLRPDGTLEIDARYMLRTDSGALLEVHNQGLRHGPADVLAALAKGEQVDPASYFYRSVLRFRTTDARWLSLNRCIALANAERRGGQAVFEVGALN